MMRIKSIGVFSFAKISGLGYFAMGLLMVPFFLIFGLIGATAARQAGAPQFPAVFFVVFAIMAPFIYGGMGFVMGAIGALVYNLLASWVGGVELDFEAVPPVYAVVPPPPLAGQPLST